MGSSDEAGHGAKPTRTHTLIIGNGPSGLAASAFLGGWRPFYDLRHPHPSRALHARLAPWAHRSLLEQDLTWTDEEAADSLSGGGNGSGVARLYDSLARPDADLGHEHPPALRWERRAEEAVEHLVLGDGVPGGAWSTFAPYVYTLSLANWMNLPEEAVEHLVLGDGVPGGAWSTFAPYVYTLSLANWMNLPGVSMAEAAERSEKAGGWEKDFDMDKDRLPCFLVADYYRNYPKNAGMERHQVPETRVISASRCGGGWRVRAESRALGSLDIAADNLVLATGSSKPRKARVPGEKE